MTDEKIKILYMITKGNFGGAQRYVYELASSLPKEFVPTIACGEGDKLKEKCEEKKIQITTLDSLKRDISIFDIKAFIETYNAIKNMDIIHLNSSKIGLFGTIAGRIHNLLHPKERINIIFTSHGWAFNDARFSYLMRLVFKILQWITVILSHKTITVSDAVKKEMLSMPWTEKKLSTIYNGIPDFEKINKEDARKILKVKTNSNIWLGTTSELTPNKGIDSAIKAFSRISSEYPDVVFVILGEGEQKKELKKIIMELDLKDRVFLCGFVPQASMYVQAFDIFTLTSRTDALPYSLLEAGIAEIPVIASRIGGIPEIIENTVSGILVRPNNIREIESAIRFMLDNPEERMNLKKTLKKTIESKFSFEDMVKNTIKNYTQI